MSEIIIKADCDIYRRVVAEIEHELGAEKHELAKLDSIARVVKQLRDYKQCCNSCELSGRRKRQP